MRSVTPLMFGVVLVASAVACAPLGDGASTSILEFESESDLDEESERDIGPFGDIDPGEADDRPRCAVGAVPFEPHELEPGSILDAERGEMIVRRGESTLGLPLTETSFDTVVVGTIAETSIIQTFHNPFEDDIEAVYVFPMPEDGAVDDYWFRIQEREIHGVMKTRDDARKMYEDAKEDGRSAALLEQERPNVFTQNVANIPPGESIEVEMHLVQPLHQEHGRYELALPTVVGPRFIPGNPVPSSQTSGGGTSPDTDRVADASRITPPALPKGQVGCANLSLSVVVDPGMPVRDFRSKFHKVNAARAGQGAAITLAGGATVPNRDFVLSWEASGKQPHASLLAQEQANDGFFTLTVQPPNEVSVDEARGRELVFVVDNSGSMSGRPIETAKDAMRYSLAHLGPRDAFQVIRFSESASALGSAPLENTPANVQRGIEYVDEMAGMGGTQMIEGIKAALDTPHDPKRMRIVLFMTDGYIGNEQEIFETIEGSLGETRIFSLGVGNSVNRYLLDGMSKVGRGAVTYMGLEEKPDLVVDRFYERIDRPVLTDVEIDWGSMPVQDVVPARVPDLFAGQPVVVFGKFSGDAKGVAKLRGKLGGKDVEIDVPIDTAANPNGSGLASMWARKRIDDLLGYPTYDQHDADETAKTEKRVIELALAHRVMTQFTSFVAVDEKKITNPDGTYKTIQVPVERPEGVKGGSFAVGNDDEDVWGGLTGTAIGTAYGVGGLGLVGKGGGGGGTGIGYGRGSGQGFGGKGKRVPRVRSAKAKVYGSIDKDVIRRIVRAHINEVRACYNPLLARDPNAAGRIAISFVIGSDGEVTEATVASDTLGDTGVATCMETALKTWRFPKPAGGGTVKVSYPFVFSPG